MNIRYTIPLLFVAISMVACQGSNIVKDDIACVQKTSDGAPVICAEEIGKDNSDANCKSTLDSTDQADGWLASAATSCPNGSKYDCDITDSAGVTRHTYFYGVLGAVKGVIACAVQNVTN